MLQSSGIDGLSLDEFKARVEDPPYKQNLDWAKSHPDSPVRWMREYLSPHHYKPESNNRMQKLLTLHIGDYIDVGEYGIYFKLDKPFLTHTARGRPAWKAR